MKFIVSKDWKSIRFVRCLTPLSYNEASDFTIYAGGTGFTLATAVEKCRSEAIEQRYFSDNLRGTPILGMAVHPDEKRAEANAWHESIEFLYLKRIQRSRRFIGVSVWNRRNIKFWVSRTSYGWFALLSSKANWAKKCPWITVYASSESLIDSMLKVWSEYRRVQIDQPPVCLIPSYTKANKLFGSFGIEKVAFKSDFRHSEKFQRDDYEVSIDKVNSHFVAYYKEGGNCA